MGALLLVLFFGVQVYHGQQPKKITTQHAKTVVRHQTAPMHSRQSKSCVSINIFDNFCVTSIYLPNNDFENMIPALGGNHIFENTQYTCVTTIHLTEIHVGNVIPTLGGNHTFEKSKNKFVKHIIDLAVKKACKKGTL